MKVILGVEARFKLERLCDSVHPQECGGVLLGEKDGEHYHITDVFPVPNTSNTPYGSYQEHSWGDHWASLYAKTVGLSKLGSFHSHPNQTIPSAGDMQAYNDSQLHLWVIHHKRGEHTFQSSIGIQHLELEQSSEPKREVAIPQFVGKDYHLGELIVDSYGVLQGNSRSIALLTLEKKERSTYLAAVLSQTDSNWVSKAQLAKQLDISTRTLANRLKALQRKGLIRNPSNSRGFWTEEGSDTNLGAERK